jgi:serine/threonine protein kinase
MINQYRILETLGEGAFGKVKLAIDTKTNVKCAIKIMNKKKLKTITMTQGKTAYDFVRQELNILQKLEHPNILWL